MKFEVMKLINTKHTVDVLYNFSSGLYECHHTYLDTKQRYRVFCETNGRNAIKRAKEIMRGYTKTTQPKDSVMEIQIIQKEDGFSVICNDEYCGTFPNKLLALARARLIVATLIDIEIQNERATTE